MDNCIRVVPVRARYCHEMCRSLNLEGTNNHSINCMNYLSNKPQDKVDCLKPTHLSHWLHQRVSNHNRDVCTTEISRITRGELKEPKLQE